MENELVRPGLFRDRREAGRLLATKLTAYANRPDVVVLAETDDLVARSTVAHITGYYVDVDELDRAGNKHTLKKWIPGTAHAGIKWLAARRPAEFREQKSVKHTLDAGDAFLAFLEKMDEANKSARAQQAKVIEHCLGSSTRRTIAEWKLNQEEFSQALRAGKSAAPLIASLITCPPLSWASRPQANR